MQVTPMESVLVDVLRRASSQQLEILKPAENQLREWETQPGFYTCLLGVFNNKQLDNNVRLMAILYFKGVVDKYWRPYQPNVLSEEEKRILKQGLLLSFDEPLSQIAIQKADIIGKIARIDPQSELSELFRVIVMAIESGNELVQHRGLLTMRQVVKSLASRRLLADRRIFNELAVSTFQCMLQWFESFNDLSLSAMMSISADTVSTIQINLEKAVLCLRMLQKLIVFGFERPMENASCKRFLMSICERISVSLQTHKHVKNCQVTSGGSIGDDVLCTLLEMCEKFTLLLIKIPLTFAEHNVRSFEEIAHECLTLVVHCLFSHEGMELCFQRFTIRCFSLMTFIVEHLLRVPKLSGKPIYDLQNKLPPLRSDVTERLKTFFSQDVLTEICRGLIYHYFLLTPEELELWDTDPEAFAANQDKHCINFNLRPCVETCFYVLFHKFQDHLTPVILEMISEINCSISPTDVNAMLRKDAVYNAVALVPFDLFDMVDFDQWFSTYLTQELTIKDPIYRIVRRRITSLIGSWTNIKLSAKLRPTMYECLLALLVPDEDLVVRLTAAAALHRAIDDCEFLPDQFINYVDVTFNLLFTLLKQTQECDNKMQVLNVITLLVERMNTEVKPHTAALMQYMPILWAESEEHNMLRCAIVAALVQVLRSLDMIPPEWILFLLPIIELGTDVNKSAIVYLLEDSLLLWQVVLEYSTVMTNEFMQLFDRIPVLLDYSTENLRSCLLIAIRHALLAPDLVMRTHGVQVITVCDNLIADMKNEAIMILLKMVETFIRCSPNLGCETVLPILPRIFELVIEDSESVAFMSRCLTVLSRVLLTSHAAFTKVVGILASKRQVSQDVVMSSILKSWLSSMYAVTQAKRHKLLALALVNLLTTRTSVVFEQFNGIVVNIVETLNDITAEDNDDGPEDSLVLGIDPSSSSLLNGSVCTAHGDRKKQLILSDPVHTIVLKDYLQAQLLELKSQMGPQQYDQLLSSVNSDTITQLKTFVSL